MSIETETYKGHEIEVNYDEAPLNPRTEWDNFTEIHCCSSSYYLGEHNHNSWEECNEAIREAKKRGDLVFKVFAYIHSGTCLSLESFHGKLSQGHAEFDSGQSGFIVVKKKDIIESWGKKKWTEKLRKKAYEVAELDIKIFNSYLNGEVYGYSVDDREESCDGYYGIEEAMDEAKSTIDWIVTEAKKKHCEQLKIWIKNKVPFSVRNSLEESLEV